MACERGLKRSTWARRVGRGEGLGVLPVLELAAHEGRADRRGARRPSAMMTGLNLKRAVDLEDPVPVLEAEEPLPAAVVEEEPAQAARAVVGVEARGHDEAEAAVRSQQGVGLLQEELVEC